MCALELGSHPDLIVGLEKGDDAGVFRLTNEIALVQTVDFFTPIVDEPFLFGKIAAANAFSDVYAMGGTPLTAMNLVCFPAKDLDISILQQTLQGGLETIREAEAMLVGGHTVEDKEFKYGLSVTGRVHPERVLTNRGGMVGDRLILTKPLGTGIISTAVKADVAKIGVRQEIVDSMITLNRQAAECMIDLPVHACTDVTGFGLIGHLAGMIEDGNIGAKLIAAELPIFNELRTFCEQGLLPGGLHRNRKYRESMIRIDQSVPQHLQDVIFDPQTSGGLLMAVTPDRATELLDRLHQAGVSSARLVGELTSNAGQISVA